MPSGTYTLLIELDAPERIEVGALGPRDFEAGWYAYTGTAFGPGGFDRIDRHRDVAAGRNETRHWHVDYLTGNDHARIDGACRTPDADAECRFSDRIDGRRVPGFGASDCDCDSHLVYNPSRERLLSSLRTIHERCEV
ncbi:MAG TPA: GIY-YIG nuclease family protein [Natrialbaceae archaeon]|nr:GIY-YIG nuclease family protein [Natrialbaceae archaeon]